MTKVFLDTEFTSLDMNSKLISLALVSEDNREFYAEFIGDFEVDEWVKANIIDNLLYKDQKFYIARDINAKTGECNTACCAYDSDIVYELKEWLEQFDKVEIWGDCIAYDWVLFCDLFGNAFNIPKNVNYIPFDIATLFKVKGVDPDISREKFINKKVYGKKHNALYDAKVIRECYKKLINM